MADKGAHRRLVSFLRGREPYAVRPGPTKKTVARLLTKSTHIAMGTAVERQLTWATIDYLQAMQCDGKRKEKTFARLTQTGESFSLRLPSHWICGFRELS